MNAPQQLQHGRNTPLKNYCFGFCESFRTGSPARLSTLRTSFPMLVGLVMVFALLAVGFGYVVFSHSATVTGYIWDIGFVLFSLAFVVTFVWVIWQHAFDQLKTYRDDRDGRNDN